MPTIAEVVRLHTDPAERLVAVGQYAERQGRALKSIGVNLNFAPVVDIDHGAVNPEDRFTRISSRAISPDPTVVTEVADRYCASLLMTGVHCTLKHFPGLGRVYGDTHMVTAHLTAMADELETSDWLPFRKLMAANVAFTMLGHARLTALDPERPASFSGPVVKGLLREGWRHDGVLVTDDFGMAAVALSREGVAGGAVAALNAGVDLVLVSYDPDQYFYIMYELLRADRDGRLRADALEGSKRRLREAAASRVVSPAAPGRLNSRRRRATGNRKGPLGEDLTNPRQMRSHSALSSHPGSPGIPAEFRLHSSRCLSWSRASRSPRFDAIHQMNTAQKDVFSSNTGQHVNIQ